MMPSTVDRITRERHLDHMTKVVPFIVFCYAIQSYIILKFAPGQFSQASLSFLGIVLAVMVGAFITYDLKHAVTFREKSFTVKFFWSERTYFYRDIHSVSINEEKQSFSTVTVQGLFGKCRFYFIDEGDTVKAFLEARMHSEEKIAA